MKIYDPVRNLRDNTVNSFEGRIPQKAKPLEWLSKELFFRVQSSTVARAQEVQATIARVQQASNGRQNLPSSTWY